EGANLTGTLEVNRLSPENQLPPSAIGPSELNPEEIAAIPGNPTLTIVQMPGNMSTFTGTSRGLILNYQTNSEGWVGSGFSYDNFITSEVETCDLSGAAELMFGLKGSPSSVKLELVDELNRKFSIRLTGLRQNSEQVYAIPSEYLNAGSADLSRTRLIYFIVEGENLTGTLEVSRFPYELQAPLLNVSAVDSDGNYTVSWNRITGAAVYQIQEDTVATFGSVSFREFWTTLPLEEITGKSPGTYLYRVKAWSARPEESGRAGSWSEVKSVQVVSAGRPHSSFISPSKPLQFGEEVQKISIYNAQGRKISEVEGNVWYGTPANTPGDTSNSLRSGPYIFKTKTKSGEEVYGTIIMIK
ncbi:MAG TPA: hypothetical protein VJC03_08685, partial [bacterium]|nr:hypothetical protein [bacterium]